MLLLQNLSMASAEHKDNGSHILLDDSSLKTNAIIEDLKLAWETSRKIKKKKKQCEAVGPKDKEGSHFSLNDSSLNTDDTSKEENPLRKQKRKRKKKKKMKQGTSIEHANKGLHVSPDDSSLKTDATSKEENSLRKQKRKRKKKKKQGKSIEHANKGLHVSQDNSSLKTDATKEVNSSRKRKRGRGRKKKKQGKDIEHKGNGCHLLVADSSLKTDATSKEVNSSQTEKDQGSHVSLDNSSLKIDATTEELNSSQKRKKKRKKKKHGKAICAAGDVTSEIPHLPLGRTITCKHYSKNKLLILDVNGLLADFTKKVPKGSKPPDFNINKKKVYKRPFCVDFIQFCLDKFHVGVWSSRVKHNLDRAINFLFGQSASKLLFCWNQSHCTKTNYFTLEDKYKPLVFKDLRKLWDKTVPNLPWEEGEFNESNTLLLDDSPYKALLNPRYTAIFPHSYHFDNTDDRSLAHDGDLRDYLKRLAMADNIQEYVSANPFGQEPITETSPSWDFYSKIIEAVKHGQNDAVIQANSSSQRSGNQNSTAMDQSTAGQPPFAVGAPPQLTEALLPPATSDSPQQPGALPSLATIDPTQ